MHTSIVHKVFRYFSKCSTLFAEINDYTASAFLCFFDCFLDTKDQVGTAMESSKSAYLLIETASVVQKGRLSPEHVLRLVEN